MTLDPALEPFLALVHSPSSPRLPDVGPVEARVLNRRLCVDLRDPATLVAVAARDDLEVAGRLARRYRPLDADADRGVLVYFHGGGFVIGDLDTHDALCRRICAEAGIDVLSVDYRLAPEHPFPAAVEDAVAVTRAVADGRTALGLSAGPLAVGGDSAGGNLAAVGCQQAREVALAAQLLIYPATDRAEVRPSLVEHAEGRMLDGELMRWFHEAYLPADADRQDPRVSPLRGDLAGLPPAVVATAGFDPLRDEGDAYAEALAAAGVPVVHRTYPSLIHGFADLDAWSETARSATGEVIADLAALLGSTPSAADR